MTEEERAEQIKAAERHLRDRNIIEAMDTALYNFSPSLHEVMPGFAATIFILIRAYMKATEEQLSDDA